jgi:hypothetical protein
MSIVHARRVSTLLLAALASATGACTSEDASTSPAELPADPTPSVERLDIDLGQAVREPMLVEHPTGALFVAGYSRDEAEFTDPPNLYRSDDGGETWLQVDVGTTADGALGNSDVDLVVGPDGALYFLTMGFDRSVAEGTHVSVGISGDVGRTWTWEPISRTRFDDRPWLALTSESVHVVWNDGSGVRHAVRSDDGSWSERERIATSGGSSHFAAGPERQLAVRIAPGSASGNVVQPDAEWIAISTDDGRSWELVDAPGEREWASIPRWVEPIAWGPDGTLYSLWSTGTEVWLAWSGDLGQTWTERRVTATSLPAYFPLFTVADDGSILATWFEGLGNEMEARLVILDPDAPGEMISSSHRFAVDAWVGEGEERVREAAGEYFPAIHLADGDLGAVLPIQTSELGDGMTWIRVRR